MALIAFVALAPSPLKKIDQEPVAALATTQPQSEKKQIQTTVAPTQVAQKVEQTPPAFDPEKPETWPKCAADEIVRADNGQCSKKPVSSPSVAQTAQTPVATNIPTDKIEIMRAAGVAESDFNAVDYIISHESGWRWWVVNSEGSGATGLCQALPGSKMASAGADYLTNPVTQLKWCSSYAASRYGGWWGAYNHWVSAHWW